MNDNECCDASLLRATHFVGTFACHSLFLSKIDDAASEGKAQASAYPAVFMRVVPQASQPARVEKKGDGLNPWRRQ